MIKRCVTHGLLEIARIRTAVGAVDEVGRVARVGDATLMAETVATAASAKAKRLAKYCMIAMTVKG